MPYRIWIIGLANGTPLGVGAGHRVFALPPTGAWLVDADVDANDGVGAILTTDNPDEAKTFADALEVMDYVRRQSTVRPHRKSDGKPNRPLTGYTVQVIKVDPLT
jgi:hypothetical protein